MAFWPAALGEARRDGKSRSRIGFHVFRTAGSVALNTAPGRKGVNILQRTKGAGGLTSDRTAEMSSDLLAFGRTPETTGVIPQRGS